MESAGAWFSCFLILLGTRHGAREEVLSGEGADDGMPSPQSASLLGDSDSLSPQIRGQVEPRRLEVREGMRN